MEGLGLDPVTVVILTLFVAGFVDFLKYFVAKEWVQALTIVIAGIAGGVAGFLLGLNILIGVCAGFAASGAITIVKRVGDY